MSAFLIIQTAHKKKWLKDVTNAGIDEELKASGERKERRVGEGREEERKGQSISFQRERKRREEISIANIKQHHLDCIVR